MQASENARRPILVQLHRTQQGSADWYRCLQHYSGIPPVPITPPIAPIAPIASIASIALALAGCYDLTRLNPTLMCMHRIDTGELTCACRSARPDSGMVSTGVKQWGDQRLQTVLRHTGFRRLQ